MDAGWVAEAMFTPTLPVLGLTEALDTPELVWATGSSGSVVGNPAIGWFGETNTTWDGGDAAQSPPLLAFGSSHVETTVDGPTVLSVKGFVGEIMTRGWSSRWMARCSPGSIQANQGR